MKNFLALSLFLLCLTGTFASPVDEEVARKAALNFLQRYTKLKSGVTDLAPGIATRYNSTTTFYVFTPGTEGWILVSADDAAIPVLAYSSAGVWNEENMNPFARKWIEGYHKEIYAAIQSRTDNPSARAEWQALLNQQFNESVTTVSPLISTLWDQSRFYNDMCPVNASAPSGYGGRVPTGCVATTMAQIMKYYNYPAQGIGLYTYNHPVYGAIAANFGNTDYNWNAMPVSATSVNAALATIMFHCGVAVNMNYDPNGSGAASEAVPYAMTNYFNYDYGMRILSREAISNDEIWRSVLRTELLAGRPVYYAGSGAAGGHAFVCDGFDASNPSKFHINWGWSGNSNGYFAIGALSTSSGAFNDYNRIIVGIKPRSNPGYICRIQSPANGDDVNAGDNLDVTVKTVKGTTSKVILYVDGIKTDSSETVPFNFTVKTTGLAPGTHSLMIKATDGNGWDYHQSEFDILKSSWQPMNIVFSRDSLRVDQIFPLDENVIWAVLSDYSSKEQTMRRFIKTTDGGTTWTEGTVECNNCSTMGISNIFPMSATKAYVCLNPGNSTGGSILVTQDGGATWTVQSTASFAGSWANWVHFFDENNGVCMGDSYKALFGTTYNFAIFTTNNGGTTWNRVTGSNLPVALTNEAGTVNFYDAAGNTIWFGTGNGRIYKSENKGLSWTVKDGVLGNVQTNVRFKDANLGYAFGGFGGKFEFRKTTDGGATWKDAIPEGVITGQDFSFVPGSDSVWMNSGLFTSVSLNDHRSYYVIDSKNFMNTTRFLSPGVGWGGGYYSVKNGGGIYKFTGSFVPAYAYKTVFRVQDNDGNPVKDATINFNSLSKFTSDNGLAVFDVKSFGNPEYYKVTKPGYSPFASNYNGTQNDTVNVVLKPSFQVAFTVKNKQDAPINDATVSFNGTTMQTDAAGTAIFNNVPGGNGYPYSVTKPRYHAGYGKTDIAGNINSLNVVLISDGTSTSAKVKNHFSVYPNPASDVLHISSEKEISAVEITTLTGRVVLSRRCQSQQIAVSLNGLSGGEYIVKIMDGNEWSSHKIVVNKNK